jgi:hypothetical protein
MAKHLYLELDPQDPLEQMLITQLVASYTNAINALAVANNTNGERLAKSRVSVIKIFGTTEPVS